MPSTGTSANTRTVRLDQEQVANARGGLTLQRWAKVLGISLNTARDAGRGKPVLRQNAQAIAKHAGLTVENLQARGGFSPPSLPSRARLHETFPLPPSRPLSRAEVARLARKTKLDNPPSRHRHLAYRPGDISYWADQPAAGRRGIVLWAEFVARRLLLEKAETDGTTYPTQGDLSHAAAAWTHQLLALTSR
jgi:hypothetical protein